ncbi:hypothetical protein [Halegenticoccus tardaugens]|uniref:hypothetical protein n=1 Tax=Halegenticoccus tardaugens TaxID=2071624 RepID=UPI00100AE622|nr:hypothetical protein [Halegenticoccus tardaugens]
MIAPFSLVRETLADVAEGEYDRAVVYADAGEETVLHEDPVRIQANGWIELPAERLLSPSSVHHVDVW